MEEHKKRDPPSREEPGSRENSLGREPVETGSKSPQSPTVAPKDLESEFMTPRKRGKRRLSSDSSNSEGESLDSRTPLKMTRVGEDVMADTATTPPASPADTIIPAATSGHDNVGKKSPQPANKPKTAPTVQKSNLAPKPRQEYSSSKPGKREQQFRSQPDGNSRRKQFQPSTRAPAFVDFPVVIHDFGGGSARFDKLGPWHRSQLLSNAVGAVRSIRPLPSGKWLIGCATEAQQSKLARLDKLPGGIPIGARIPRPVVEGVVGPIPMGGDELKLVRQDLEAGGHRVAGVVRLNNRKQEPSLAVKISLEATELPSEVWLGATPFTVQAFAAPVRRCTKCQTLGHSRQQCRSKQTRCSKCGKGSHSHEQCDAQILSCVNCNGRHSAAYKGCPEEQDLPTLQRRHAEGPRPNETQGSAPCTACLRRSGQLLVARPDSTVLALCGHRNSGVVREGSSEGRHGQQGAQQEEPHQPTPGTELSGSGENPRQENPVCGKRRPL